MFFEIGIILTLVIALLYFIFDIKSVIIKVVQLICSVTILIMAGFFIGIGIHLTNLIFGW